MRKPLGNLLPLGDKERYSKITLSYTQGK